MGLFDSSPIYAATDSLWVQAYQLAATVFMVIGGYYLYKLVGGYRLRPTPPVRIREHGFGPETSSSTMSIDTPRKMGDWTDDED